MGQPFQDLGDSRPRQPGLVGDNRGGLLPVGIGRQMGVLAPKLRVVGGTR